MSPQNPEAHPQHSKHPTPKRTYHHHPRRHCSRITRALAQVTTAHGHLAAGHGARAGAGLSETHPTHAPPHCRTKSLEIKFYFAVIFVVLALAVVVVVACDCKTQGPVILAGVEVTHHLRFGSFFLLA